MKRITLLVITIAFLPILLFAIVRPATKPAQAAPNAATPVGIPTNRSGSGTIKNTTQGIFGPQICTAYGDPFSPITSVWDPDFYTYQYQIRIPADYPSNVVRVELFDPDSVNQSENEFTVVRSSNAQNHPTDPFSPFATKSCGINGGSSEQKNPCALQTDELDLTTPPANPTYTIDDINPFWFARVDENRGAGDPVLHGNNQCGVPTTYEPGFNTQTYFALYYRQDDGHGGHTDMPLASYTGNTGDSRDVNGFHETDLRWVSPGADKQGYDYPIADTPGVSEVPTNEGNTSFEVDLTSDVSNIVTDPITGERFLYLDVTTLSGASENVFEIWAGPADYVDTLPSDVNTRNLAIVNAPGAHHAYGVQVEAIGVLPINNLYGNAIDWPIAYFSPTAAGGTVSISIFDTDSGWQPPITFFFDSIPESEWSLTFSDPGVDDPDGVSAGTRCQIENNGCNDQWISPSYQITIPGDLSNCDPLNPTQADCTPFVGGRLMARVIGGEYDTHVWQVTADLPTTTDPTQSCAAFPIAIASGIRSATAPGTGSSPYPETGDFDYPASPPAFSSFTAHTENVDLASASAGTIFVLERGAATGFDWLVWNVGIFESGGTVLSNSLTWPGDSFDYSDHGDAGSQAAAGIPYVVRGYAEPGDGADLSLQVADWVAGSASQLPEIAPAVQTLIDDTPVLRLIVQNQAEDAGMFGPNGRFAIDQFALFKLHGYGNSSANNEWLLLEFMGFDDSCGQLQTTEDIDLTIGNVQIIDQGTLHQEQPFSVQATISNTGTVDVDSQFFVDLYLNPTQTNPLLIGESVGYTAVSALAAGTQQTVTITTTAGTTRLLNNTLYAMVDSLNQTAETDETNNAVSIEFDVLPKEEWLIYLPFVQRP